MEVKITQRRRNIRSSIEQKIKLYSTGEAKGLVHGFQKDAIQNGWGHRKHVSSGKDWKMIFRLVNNDHGDFLVVEDIGCTGLIGNNYSQKQIQEMMNENIPLDEKEKLARFSTLNNSGGNTSSAGTYGIGKQMYQAVSSKLKYYFDSNTIEGKYVANYIDECEMTYENALENEEAVNFIYKETGLERKETEGTRIIIVNPIEEVVTEIKNGKFAEYISETWWRIILKYQAVIEIYDNNTLLNVVSIPKFYETNMNNQYYQEYENIVVTSEYKVKRIGIGFNPDIDKNLSNISYYRKDMKIGNIFNEYETIIDNKYKNIIWGFIEFEDNSAWENDLKENEDLVHYGPENKNRSSFSKMKSIVQTKLNEYALSKGLINNNDYKDVDRELNDLANNLTDFLKKSNFKLPWENSIRKKGDKAIIIESIKKYPNESSRTIENNQKITMKYKVSNSSLYHKFNVDIDIITENICKNFKKDYIEINDEYISDEIDINYSDFYENLRNIVSIKIISTEKNDIIDKCTFPVYVNIDEEPNEEDFGIQLYYELPHESLSVYSQETIKNISVDIINNSLYNGSFSLRMLTQDVEDRNNTIATEHLEQKISVESEKTVNVNIGNLFFGEKYFNRRGPIRIKFILIHDSGIENRERGEKIRQKFFTILFNTEQIDNSIKPPFNATQSPLKDNIYLKSKFDGENLIFNTLYPLWKYVSQDNKSFLYKMYSIEVIFKTILKMQMDSGDYSTLGITEEQFISMSSIDLNQLIEKKVAEYVGKYFEVK